MAAIMQVWGYEAARLDRLALNALNGVFPAQGGKSAVAFVQDQWLARVGLDYTHRKPEAGSMRIPKNTKLGLDAIDLTIQSNQARAKYWAKINQELLDSGFYTWLDMMAQAAQLGSQSDLAQMYGNPIVSVQSMRLDPEVMKQYHEATLRSLSVQMDDQTKYMAAEGIALEYGHVIVPLLSDPDALQSICPAPRGRDPIEHFWNNSVLDVKAEALSLQLGEQMLDMLSALADYDPNKPYVGQIFQWLQPARNLRTTMDMLAQQTVRQFKYTPSSKKGVEGVVETLTLSVSLSVSTPSGTTQVDVETNLSKGGRRNSVDLTVGNVTGSTIIVTGGDYVGRDKFVGRRRSDEDDDSF